ncbi:MAG: transposase [PVC group bacterium]
MLMPMTRPTFPTGLREFRQRFLNDAACWEYLSQSRWPEGFRCPKCDLFAELVASKPACPRMSVMRASGVSLCRDDSSS